MKLYVQHQRNRRKNYHRKHEGSKITRIKYQERKWEIIGLEIDEDIIEVLGNNLEKKTLEKGI